MEDPLSDHRNTLISRNSDFALLPLPDLTGYLSCEPPPQPREMTLEAKAWLMALEEESKAKEKSAVARRAKMFSRNRDLAAFMEEVKNALDEAGIAAEKAYLNYALSAPRLADSGIADAYGFAWVEIHSASYRLRECLKHLGHIRIRPGVWSLDYSDCARVFYDHSVTGREVACDAACNVLKIRLHQDGEFERSSRMD